MEHTVTTEDNIVLYREITGSISVEHRNPSRPVLQDAIDNNAPAEQILKQLRNGKTKLKKFENRLSIWTTFLRATRTLMETLHVDIDAELDIMR